MSLVDLDDVPAKLKVSQGREKCSAPKGWPDVYTLTRREVIALHQGHLESTRCSIHSCASSSRAATDNLPRGRRRQFTFSAR